MEDLASQTPQLQSYLGDILHAIAQALLAPDILLLIALIAYAVFCIGSVLMEFFTERRHYKVTMPQFLASLTNAAESVIPQVISESGLLRRQKDALMTVYDYRTLPGDALIALVKRLMNQEEAHYDRITGRNAMAAKIAPMLGLVGTLIPLGPGIQALGEANTELLSSSLLIAFDTTVAGLVVAAVCLVVGKIRTAWYDNYMSALDSAMATMVQKIEDSRALGIPGFAVVEDYTAMSPFGSAAYQTTAFAAAAPATAPAATPASVPAADPAMPIAGVVMQDDNAIGSDLPDSKYGKFPKGEFPKGVVKDKPKSRE